MTGQAHPVLRASAARSVFRSFRGHDHYQGADPGRDGNHDRRARRNGRPARGAPGEFSSPAQHRADDPVPGQKITRSPPVTDAGRCSARTARIWVASGSYQMRLKSHRTGLSARGCHLGQAIPEPSGIVSCSGRRSGLGSERGICRRLDQAIASHGGRRAGRCSWATIDGVQVFETGAGITGPLAPYAQVDRARAGNGCWVMASMAGGLDGPAAISGRAGALSTGPDAALPRRMRAFAYVVLAEAQTVWREGYRGIGLPREPAAARQAAGRPAVPRLAVLTRSLDLDWSGGAFAVVSARSRALVITGKAAGARRVDRAREVADVVFAGRDQVDLGQAVQRVWELGHRVVLCEGGTLFLRCERGPDD